MKNLKSTVKMGLIMMVGAIALTSLCASLSFALDDNLPTIDPSNVPNSVLITYDKANPADAVNTKMIVNAPDKTIMNFSSFNISNNYSVQIVLPTYNDGTLASFLARDLSGSASNINGALNCNGLFMLTNTNGINIGSTAQINAASLVMSTRDITNTNFLSANYIFEKQLDQQTDRLLLNKGTITISQGGFGVLIAGAIDNQGLIVCPMGTIALAGGDHVRLDISANKMISIAIDQAAASTIYDYNGKPIAIQINNAGTLEANGGTVILRAESLPGIFEKAINMGGYIKADKVEDKGGVVKLISSGDIEISGDISAAKIEIGQEATPPANINMTNGARLISEESVKVASDRISVNTASPVVEINKTQGAIHVSNSKNVDNLITIEGEGLKVTYMVTSDFTLKCEGTMDTSPAVILQGGSVTVIANKFGNIATPLTIDSGTIHIKRLNGDIDILQSTGIGTSVQITGPPDGFGKIIYPKTSSLVLEAARITVSTDKNPVYFYGDITFYNFECTTPGKELIFEAGRTYIFKGSLNIAGYNSPAGIGSYYIKLISGQTGSQYYINIDTDSCVLDRVAISDAYISNYLFIERGTDNGNNFNLEIDPIWDGGGTTLLWSNAGNWENDTIPVAGSAVTFNSTSVKDSLVDAAFGGTIASLTISSGYTGTISLARDLTVTGAFSQADGTFNETYDTTGANPYNLTAGSVTKTAGTFNGPHCPGAASTPATRISSIADLETIYLSANLGKNYVQTDNINLVGVAFAAYVIGNASTNFTGKYNGYGYTISNLTISAAATNSIGLFGCTSSVAVLSNIYLESVSVVGLSTTGGLVGSNSGSISNSYITGSVRGGSYYVGGLVGTNVGTISNSYSTGSVSGTAVVGGFVGRNDYGIISNSYSTGSVSGSSAEGNVGGFVGWNNCGTIINSYTTGNVSSSGWAVGGLVGYNGYGPISNSYSTGSVRGTLNSVGGLVGYNSRATISNSYSSGSVSGSSYDVGGLVGNNDTLGFINNSYSTGSVSGTYNVGGLVGYNNSSGFINNSYATGTVTGNTATVNVVGPLTGTQGTINYSYYAGTASNLGAGGVNTYGTGSETVAKLKDGTAAVYTAGSSPWMFDSTHWVIDSGISYPYLYHQVWTWTGSGDAATWASSTNWSNPVFTGYPSLISHKAVIDTGSASITTPVSSLTLGSLKLATGYSGTVTLGGNLTLNSTSALCGSLTVQSGTLAISNKNIPTVGTVILSGGAITGTSGTITSSTGYDFRSGSVSAILAGSVGLTKTTTDTVTLTGVNTYTGTTTISSGTLTLSGTGTALETTFTIQGGTLTLDNSATNVTDRIGNAKGITMNGGSFNFIGYNSGVSDASETAGALTIGSGDNIVTITPGSGTGKTTMTFASFSRSTGGTVLFRGTNFDQAAGSGISTLVFTAAPTLTGIGTTAGNPDIGVIRGAFGDGSLTGTGTDMVTYLSGEGKLRLLAASEYTATLTTDSNVKLTGSVTPSANVTINSLVLAANGAIANPGSAYTITIGASSNAGSGNILTLASCGNIAGANTTLAFGSIDISIRANGATNISAVIGGATPTGGLNKTGSATLTLSNANTYTGTTLINASTLAYGASNVLASGAVTVDGSTAILALGSNQSDTVGTVTVANGGSITGSGTSTMTTTGTFEMQSGSVSAILAGAVALNKTTTGTVTLSGVNTYTGVTTITAGTLSVSTIGNGGVAGNLGAAPAAASNIVLDGGILSYTGSTASTNRGFTVNVTNGEIDVNKVEGEPAQTLTIDTTGIVNGGILTIGGSGNTTISSVISSTGCLVKTGSGTLTLSNTNSYAGTTTVNAGTLAYGASDVIASGAVTVSGATAVLAMGNNQSDTVGTVTVANGGSITGTGSSTLTTTGTYEMQSGSVSAILAGAVALNKTTSGTVTLSGVNTYTGVTTISAGTLSVSTIGNGGVAGNLGAAPAAATNIVLNGGTLSYTGNTASTNRGFTIDNVASEIDTTTAGQTLTIATTGIVKDIVLTIGGAGNTTISSIISGSYGLTKIGTGTLTLSGTNTYSSITRVSTGILVVANNSALGLAGVYQGTYIESGAEIAISGSGLSIAESILGIIGTGVSGAGALCNLANNNSWTGGIVLGINGATIASNSGTLTISTSSITGATQPLTVSGAGNVTISVAISTSTGTLTKAGSGTLTLSNTNTYTGITTVNAGTLAYGASDVIATGAVTVSGATAILAMGSNRSDTVGTVTVANGGSITGSGTSTMTTTGTFEMQSGSVSTILAGAVALNKTTDGTVTLSGVNTYTGVTTITAGTLSVSAIGNGGVAGNLGAAPAAAANIVLNGGILSYTGSTASTDRGFTINATNGEIDIVAGESAPTLTIDTTGIVNAGTLTIGGSGNTTISSVISSTGGLTKTGAGTLTLSNTNTYSGATAINGGIIKISAAANLGNSAVTNTIAFNTGTLQSTSGTYSLGANRAVTLNGAGTIQSDAGILTVDGSITNGANLLTVTGAGDVTISGVIGNGAGGLTKTGAGTLTLSNTNTYSGATAINGGIIKISAAANLGNSAVTNTIAFNTGTLQSTSGTYSLGANRAVTLNGAGTIQSDAGILTVDGSITNGANLLTVTGAGDVTISGVIGNGAGGLTKTGSGTLTLSNTNTYTGVTTIRTGTISVAIIGLGGNAGNLGAAKADAANIVLDGGTLSYTGNTANTDRGFTVNATNGEIDTVTIFRTLTINTTGIVTAGTLTIGGSGNTTISSVISSTGGLTKAGSGTLTLSNTNSYAGTTTVNAGTLAYGISNALGSGSVTVDGATAVLAMGSNRSDTVGTVTVANGGSITGSGTSTLTTTGTFEMQSGSVNAILAGAVALNKTTNGTVTLSGVNTYTGVTTISAGTLSVSAIGNGGVAGNIGAAPAAAANIVLDGGILSYTGSTASTDRGFTVNATNGEIDIAAVEVIPTLTIDTTGIVTAGTLTIGGDGNITISSVISSTGGLTKTGTGTLTLSNTNTYSGATAINGGIIKIGTAANLGNSAVTNTIAFNTGTLQSTSGTYSLGTNRAITLNGAGTIQSDAGILTVDGSITNGANLLTVTGAGDVTISGVIGNGAGGLTKTGAGTLTLSNTNTYSGATAINGGIIKISTAANLGNSAVTNTIAFNTGTLQSTSGTYSLGTNRAITLNGAGTIQSDAGILTVDGSITNGANLLTVTGAGDVTISGVIGNGAGGLTKTGAGTLTLSNTNTYSGATAINGGIIKISTAANLGNSAVTNTIAFNTGTLQSTSGTYSLGTNRAITLNGAGTIQSDAGILTVDGSITNGANLLTVTGAGDVTISGVIGNGAGGLTKTGAGTLTLSNTNTYSGATAINGGIIKISTAANLGNSAVTNTIAFNTGTLQSTSGTYSLGTNRAITLNGAGTIQSDAGILTVDGSITNGANLLTVTGAGDVTISGVIGNGAGGLTKTGAGTLTLSNTNTYSGATAINGGIIKISTAANLGNSAVTNTIAFNTGTLQSTSGTYSLGTNRAITLNGAGTIQSDAGILTVDGSITNGANLLTVTGAGDVTISGVIGNGAGGLTKTGNGTLSITNTLTVGGSLTILAGTISANNSAINVGGDWFNTGIFTAGTSTVTFTGSNQSISGNNTFYNITKNGTGTLTFKGDDTQIIEGLATLKGTGAGQMLTLNKNAAGTYWNIKISSDNYSFQYLDVHNSNNTGAVIYAPDSYVDSNSIGWVGSARPNPSPTPPTPTPGQVDHATYENNALINDALKAALSIDEMQGIKYKLSQERILAYLQFIQKLMNPYKIRSMKIITDSGRLYIVY